MKLECVRWQGTAGLGVDLDGEGKGKGRVDGREDKYFLEIDSSLRNGKHPISAGARHMSNSEIEHVSLRQFPLLMAAAHAPPPAVCSAQKASVVGPSVCAHPANRAPLVPRFCLYVSEASPPPSDLIEFRRDHSLARFKFGYLVVSVTCPLCLRPSHPPALNPHRRGDVQTETRPENFQPGGYFSICQPCQKSRACWRESPP